jgi:hypothetical protein
VHDEGLTAGVDVSHSRTHAGYGKHDMAAWERVPTEEHLSQGN